MSLPILRLPAALLVTLLMVASCASDASISAFSWEAFVQPPVEARPWARWWWPGNDVLPAELTSEVKLAAANGFGGLELQAFDAALNPDDPVEKLAVRRSADTEAYYENLRTALEAARQAGLQLDVTLGSGWPTGGPFVKVEDSMRTLLSSEHTVKGPGSATVTFTGPDKDPFYSVAEIAAQIGEPMGQFLPSYAKLVAVVAGRVVLDDRYSDVFVLTDTVTLDPSTIQVLTDRVKADGTMDWEVPDGDWRVVGLWAMPDGEAVSLHAYSGESFVLDHFDAVRVGGAFEQLLGARTGLAPYFGKALRGVFVDSFELECERHWADDFVAQFKERRGYDVTPWLPVVLPPGADNQLFDGAGIAVAPTFVLGDDDQRVRFDYQLTVSDLFIERFLGTAGTWSESRGLSLRVQPYGIRVDALKAAGATTIPETEQLFAGGSELFLKSVSSGAHLYGRRLVGAESLVWGGRDWMTTPRKAKAAMDKLFAAGVNAVTYHGLPYRTGDAAFGQTDWLPFCSTFGGMGTYSTGIGQADPFWPWMPDLNRYVGRVQYALRLGEPEADLLVYFPWLAVPASLMRLDDNDESFYLGRFEDEAVDTGNSSLLSLIDGLFGGKSLQPATVWMGGLRPVLAALQDRGYSWDWVNDDRLAAAVAADRFVEIGGRRYRGILVPDTASISPEAAEALARLASAGVPLVFAGATPVRQPGYSGKQAGDARVLAAIATAVGGTNVRQGAVLTDLPSLLADAGVKPWLRQEAETSSVRHIRRLLPGGQRIIFLQNPGVDPVALSFSPMEGCAGPQIVDPWEGSARTLVAQANGVLQLDMPAYGSRLLLCGVPTPADQGVAVPLPVPVPASASERLLPVEGWNLRVQGTDVPGGVFQIDDAALGDWRARTELAGSASPGVYSATVEIGSVGSSDRVLLDLGWLHGAARVRFNGSEVGAVVVPPYQLDVTSVAASGVNTIDVTLTPPQRNRMLALGDADDPTARQFKGKPETRIASGLMGPVVVRVGVP
jgi:hypothetical protein